VLRLTKIGGHLVHINIGEPGVDAQLPLLEDLPVGLRLVLLVQQLPRPQASAQLKG